ncbi:MAG TPA: hypothetical protein VGY66_07315 [Gemmataceae bacterium]|nr:hypothetical protein [Gemmataceae bacterium]
MLFSRNDLADYVNDTFESAWETVRPVPIVRIDFGNGNVLTRTLQGNIASYVCNGDGHVLDVLPGIYDPAGYRKGLEQLSGLAKSVGKQPPDQRPATLANYHLLSLLVLEAGQPAAQSLASGFQTGGTTNGSLGGGMAGERSTGSQIGFGGGLGKLGIEGGVKSLLASPGLSGSPARSAGRQTSREEQVPPLDSAADLANWKALREDTQLNETVRRRQIHAMLASKGLIRPREIAKPIYKEVLHADLDDPYLGLGNILFANYPFAKEDNR